MLTSRQVIGALCAGALLLGACSSGGADPEDGATTTDAASPVATETPSPSETSESEDPWAVPDPITEEYVDRVVNRIYEEWGAITREILEQDPDPTGTTPVEVRERIGALFGGQYLQRRFEEATQRWRGDRDGVLPARDFSQIEFSTRHIFTASTDCIVIAGDFETAGTAVEPETTLAALSLAPSDGIDETQSPTGWRIVDLVPNTQDGEPMADDVMLDATLDDFADVLETSCQQ